MLHSRGILTPKATRTKYLYGRSVYWYNRGVPFLLLAT